MSRPPLSVLITPEIATRFHAKVDQSPHPDGCWLWTGSTNKGYGVQTVRHAGKKHFVPAHQVALHLSGRTLEPGQVTRHLCGHTLCCNPEHLQPGTQLENVRDRSTHQTHASGERNGRAVLTAAQVAAIRAEPGAWGLLSRLAKQYGVHVTTIRDIRLHRIWKEAV